MNSAKETIHQWFEEVWNQRDDSAIDRLMAPDCEIIGAGPEPVNREGFKEFRQTVLRTFENIHMEIVDAVADEVSVAGHTKMTATHCKACKPVEFVFSFSTRLEEGKFVWVRNVVDYTAMMSQLDAISERAVAEVFA